MSKEQFFEWLYDTCPIRWTALKDDLGNTTIKFKYEVDNE